MGGAIRVAGNAEGGAEWNAHADAAALETVLLSQLPLTICPLDLTNAFPARADVIVNARTAIQRQVKKAYGEKGRYWWDELAAAAMVAPGLFARRTERVGMVAGGKLVADGRGRAVTRLSDCQAEGFQNLMKMAWHY
jgi:purine nucleosidase